MSNEDAIKTLENLLEAYCEGLEPVLVDEDIKAIDMACAALERDRWISASKPPEENGWYMVRYLREIDIDDGITDDEIRKMRFLKNSGWRYPVICNADVRECVTMETVTHWRPLPAPPKEDKP